MTHYDTLGVPVGAAPEVVRDAYKELARRYHPDANAREAPEERRRTEQRMREVNEAWAVLRDPGSKAAYDRRIGAAGGRSFVQPRPAPSFTPLHPDDDDEDDDALLVGYEEDEGDPRSAPGRGALAVPIALSGAALLAFGAWVLVGEEGLFVVAVVLTAMAAVSFFALPILAMSKAAQGERGRPFRGDQPDGR